MSRAMNEGTRERLLAAAAAAFRSPTYNILKNIDVAQIARLAGISEAQARRYFLLEDLHTELIRYMLTPGLDPQNLSDFDVLDAVERNLTDHTLRPDDSLQEALDTIWPANIDDPGLLSQMALWPYAEGNPDIRDSLIATYEPWHRGVRDLINSFITHHSHLVRLRPGWLTVADAAVLINIIAEGAAIQARLHQATGQPGYGFDLTMPGRAVRAIIGSMIQFHDENEHPLDAQYRRLHERRSGLTDEG